MFLSRIFLMETYRIKLFFFFFSSRDLSNGFNLTLYRSDSSREACLPY